MRSWRRWRRCPHTVDPRCWWRLTRLHDEPTTRPPSKELALRWWWRMMRSKPRLVHTRPRTFHYYYSSPAVLHHHSPRSWHAALLIAVCLSDARGSSTKTSRLVVDCHCCCTRWWLAILFRFTPTGRRPTRTSIKSTRIAMDDGSTCCIDIRTVSRGIFAVATFAIRSTGGRIRKALTVEFQASMLLQVWFDLRKARELTGKADLDRLTDSSCMCTLLLP